MVGVAVCTSHSLFGPPSDELPSGLTGSIIARHHGIAVSDILPEHLGEGLAHTVYELSRYRPNDAPGLSAENPDVAAAVAQLYREFPNLSWSGSADGLGHTGVQSASGFYFVIRTLRGRCVAAAPGLVGGPADEAGRSAFCDTCNAHLRRATALLGLHLMPVPLEALQAEWQKEFGTE
jgi:hypothetical protein